MLEIIVIDRGRGIADPAAILAGEHRSTTRMGIGITGARRLMDSFRLDSTRAVGTVVRMGKLLPRCAPVVAKGGLKNIVEALAHHDGLDQTEEISRQNKDMSMKLEILHAAEAARTAQSGIAGHQSRPRGAFELSEAATGQEALRKLRDHVPDIVLLDLDMPVMDGFEFPERLRANGGTSRTPAIVVMSMSISDENRRRLSTAPRIVPKSDLTGDVLVGAIRDAIGACGALPQ